jgi:thiamine-phosphate pyrophosphorylase
MRRPDWRLCVITDAHGSHGRSHLDVAEAAIRGGAGVVQLRMKEEPARQILDVACAIASRCLAAGVLFIVNDRVDVAMMAEADGAHVGQDDLPPAAVRAVMGPRAVIGVSAATVEEALAAERAGADYLGVGSIYGTRSKADAGAPVGPARIAEISRAVRLPVVGIGGISAGNAAEVIRAGAQGIAVISAVTRAEDMVAAVRELRRVIDAAGS